VPKRLAKEAREILEAGVKGKNKNP
jgi:hypothetical protein